MTRRTNRPVWVNLCQRWLFLCVLWFTVLLSHPLGQVWTFACVCFCVYVFMCDLRQTPASMTRLRHLRVRHISPWQLRARTLCQRSIQCECMFQRFVECAFSPQRAQTLLYVLTTQRKTPRPRWCKHFLWCNDHSASSLELATLTATSQQCECCFIILMLLLTSLAKSCFYLHLFICN